LNESTVLLDASTYQGFGRPGLEAMACGAVPVLTFNGGITSYAVHEHNSMLIDPFDVAQIVETIERVFDDEGLRNRLRTEGARTAEAHSHKLEGKLTQELILSLEKAAKCDESGG
jgi:glycosyltransferase involved in cell wall biosynthesis